MISWKKAWKFENMISNFWNRLCDFFIFDLWFFSLPFGFSYSFLRGSWEIWLFVPVPDHGNSEVKVAGSKHVMAKPVQYCSLTQIWQIAFHASATITARSCLEHQESFIIIYPISIILLFSRQWSWQRDFFVREGNKCFEPVTRM